MSSSDSRVLYIVGPTATGKTQLALSLAQQFGGEIINADSRQVYRYMDIGTAKPTAEERALVPHHLFDLLTPSESFSLGSFLSLARAAIADIRGRGCLPIVAGGTGQYIWALRERWDVPEVAPDHDFRSRQLEMAEKEGSWALHQRLQELDPVRASEVDPRNVRRVIRALEIHHVTGKVPTEFRKRSGEEVNSPVIGLTMARDLLYDRIDQRVESMMESGFLDEARNLARMGYTLGEGPLACPGYRELGQYLAGELSLEDAVQRTKYQTHRLARRQHSWFKSNDPRISWLNGTSPNLEGEAANLAAQAV